MKRLDTTQSTATAWSPYPEETRQFLQDANSEVFEALIKSIVGSSYSASVPYVIEGCVISGVGPYSITAGKIFYGGVFYNVNSGSSLAGPIEFKLVTTNDGVADPIEFSDGSTHNIHKIDKYNPVAAGTSGTDFAAGDLVSVYSSLTVNIGTASNGQAITVNQVSGGPFTYTTDSYVYSHYSDRGICHINFEVTFTVTAGGVISALHIPLPSGITKLTTLSAAQSFKGSASFSAPSGTTNYLMLQSYSNNGGGEGQRITLKRCTEGDTEITLSTVVTTVRGEIRVQV